jgi:hypothetical protein
MSAPFDTSHLADINPWPADGTTSSAPRELLATLAAAASASYEQTWPDAQPVTFSDGGFSFLFDLAEAAGSSDRESRTVLAWGQVASPVSKRDASRQRGHPLSQRLRDAGYERGHLIAYKAGGGMDANLFAQARRLNRGWSEQGKRFVALEHMARNCPGCWVMHELIYTQDGPVPDATRFLVLVDGVVHQGAFSNLPADHSVMTKPL